MRAIWLGFSAVIGLGVGIAGTVFALGDRGDPAASRDMQKQQYCRSRVVGDIDDLKHEAERGVDIAPASFGIYSAVTFCSGDRAAAELAQPEVQHETELLIRRDVGVTVPALERLRARVISNNE